MSYDCDNCGKNSVDMYGKWCSECQEKEKYAQEDSDARWYSESALCMKCGNAWGPDPPDKCEAYDMPLYMVKRKKKCKRFNEFKEMNYDSFYSIQ